MECFVEAWTKEIVHRGIHDDKIFILILLGVQHFRCKNSCIRRKESPRLEKNFAADAGENWKKFFCKLAGRRARAAVV